MKIRSLAALGICLLSATVSVNAQVTMTALSSFGGGDGWLAPGEGGYTFLGTANNERGMSFGNGHVYLVSRNGGNNIRILNATTGADLGALNNSGISGGTFAVSTVAVGGDGMIYVANLTTAVGAASPYKIYSWATEASTPTTAFSTTTLLAGSRIGDTLAATGSGASTVLAAGFGSTPVVAGNNGYAIISPSSSSGNAIAFTGTPPNAGDFRLGLTFSDSSHVIGTAGSSLYRYTTFTGTSGTLLGSPAIPDPAGATADRLLAYTTIGGRAILAVQSIGDSHVSIYDVSNPLAPLWLASGNNTSGALTANSNGTGNLAWGDIVVNGDGTISEALYAMSTNQGIQAFIVTVPEPGTLTLVALGIGCLALRRKMRR